MCSAAETDFLMWSWAQQSCWSQAADRLKSSWLRARTVALCLTIAVAVFVTAAGQFGDLYPLAGRILAWLGTASALLVARAVASRPASMSIEGQFHGIPRSFES
jgi:hypothetical protein